MPIVMVRPSQRTVAAPTRGRNRHDDRGHAPSWWGQPSRPGSAEDDPAVVDRLRRAEAEIPNLRIALRHNRGIGTAVGLLMSSQKITREESFDQLREASMWTNVRPYFVALQVIETGGLPIP